VHTKVGHASGLVFSHFQSARKNRSCCYTKIFSRNNNYQAKSWNEKLLFSEINEQQLLEEKKNDDSAFEVSWRKRKLDGNFRSAASIFIFLPKPKDC